MRIRSIRKDLSLSAGSQTFQEFEIRPHEQFSMAKVLDLQIFGPEEGVSGATDGTHRLGIGTRTKDLAPSWQTFVQLEAPYNAWLRIYGSRTPFDLYEADSGIGGVGGATFPRTEDAFQAGVRSIHFDQDNPMVVRYTNLTDAAASGSLTILVTYLALEE